MSTFEESMKEYQQRHNDRVAELVARIKRSSVR
jgi:L-rhamnose mutarotase